MKPRSLRGRHYASRESIEVNWEGDTITSLQTVPLEADDPGLWIAPAFFDLQINGCDGQSFNSKDLTEGAIQHVVSTCRRHGISALLPTLVTNDHDSLCHGFRTLARACENDRPLARSIPGFHLEGPYISAEDGPRGAHPRPHVREPDWDEFQRFQDAAGGRIRLVTLAPELPGAIGFIERLARSDIVVALGHTAASGEQIHAAAKAGARLSTHLGNGCSSVLPRHDNPIWPQLADDHLWISVISDGHHLPADVVRCFLSVKTPRRTVITCDASSLAGCPPGRYRQWDQEFEVLPSRKVVVPGTGYLAGSGVLTDACVGTVIEQTSVNLADAIDMASARPRELLALPTVSLRQGSPADLILFDWRPGSQFVVKATVVGGEMVSSGQL